MADSEPLRELTSDELLVLAEVEAIWGDQDRDAHVFRASRGALALMVHDREGVSIGFVVLTNLGAWYRDGRLSIEDMRAEIRSL